MAREARTALATTVSSSDFSVQDGGRSSSTEIEVVEPVEAQTIVPDDDIIDAELVSPADAAMGVFVESSRGAAVLALRGLAENILRKL